MPTTMSRLLALALTWLAVPLALPGAALADDDGPAPVKCDPYTPEPNCYWKPNFVDFTLAQHVVRVGEVLVGTVSFHLPAVGSGEFETHASVALDMVGAQGLKLLGCKRDGKPIAGSATISNGVGPGGDRQARTEGTVVCRWRATKPTRWSTDLGAVLAITGSPNAYKAGDFYQVSGDQYVEGTIRIENNRKENRLDLGIPGSRVMIEGKGKRISPAVNKNGFFFAAVKPGTYTVTPIVPSSFKTGKGGIKPPSRKVVVEAGETAKADFVVEDTYTVTIAVDRSSVPADGLQVVNATVHVTDHGAPVPNELVEIRPYDGKVLDVEQLPVPGVVCTSNQGRRWPDTQAGRVAGATTKAFRLLTDASGDIRLQVALGTIPGSFPLGAWALDANGDLQTKDIGAVSPSVDIAVTPLAGSGAPNEFLPAALRTAVQQTGLSTSLFLWDQLEQWISQQRLGPVNIVPIIGSGGLGAAAVFPAGQRTSIAADGTIDPGPGGSTAGVVVDPATWIPTSLAATFEDAIRGGYVVRFPTFGEWQLGGKVTWPGPSSAEPEAGWNIPVHSGNVRAQYPSDLAYAGFGYHSTHCY